MGLGIRSDQPLVAAAWAERRATTADRMGDFAWTAATPALRGVAGVLLPGLKGTTKRLLLTAGPAPASAQVRLGTGSAAKVSTVAVPADSTVAVAVGDADAVWVVPDSRRGPSRRLRRWCRRGSAVLLGGPAQRRARAGTVGPGASGAQLTVAASPSIAGAAHSPKPGSSSSGETPSRPATCSVTMSATSAATSRRSVTRVSTGRR